METEHLAGMTRKIKSLNVELKAQTDHDFAEGFLPCCCSYIARPVVGLQQWLPWPDTQGHNWVSELTVDIQHNTWPQLSMSSPLVTVGCTWQTWSNRQILLPLLINCTLQAPTIKIQHAYASCQIRFAFARQRAHACLRACVLRVAGRQKASMTQLQLFSFSARLQTAVIQTRCCGSPRGPFI